MAATFVVEDGSGKVDANSYVSVAFADQYFLEHGSPLIWPGLTSPSISFAAADNSVNDAASRFLAIGFRAGMSVVLSGSTGGQNDGRAKVAVATAGKLVLAGISLAEEAAGETVSVLPDQEEALREGALFLDLEYGERLPGRPRRIEQARRFPRTGICVDSREVRHDEVPIGWKQANCEAARRYIEKGELLPSVEQPGAVKSVRKKFAVIETATTYSGGRADVPWLRKIDLLVAPYLQPSGLSLRG